MQQRVAGVQHGRRRWRWIATDQRLDFVLLELERLVEAHNDVVDKDSLGNLLLDWRGRIPSES